jgi:polar amino acid transport system ATP-binding protein
MRVKNICKKFGKTDVLKNVSFELAAGENLAIVGESGSGKTTLLRILAGLEQADSGEVEFDGEIGFIFQDYNLFPHLTVWQNITLAAPHADLYYLEKMELAAKKDEYPCNLSGGQKQRAAIARALALKPAILCFDEPTSALDPRLTDDVAQLINSLDTTCIVVTHDIDFARKIANKKLIIGGKKVVRYADLIDIPVADNGERFVKFQGLLVRETVAKKLSNVDLDLELLCGYRDLSEQNRMFDQQMKIYKDVEMAHKKVAEPSVAGHPTGGAVDVRIKGMPDLSFENCEYNQEDPNERRLNEAMVDAGFAPFWGEWWHFSYGDREWAAYYGKESAIYSQKDLAYSYKIYSPCGNITALVEGDYVDKKRINNEIESANPNVEQVGFLSGNRLDMAGGEFCANAARAAVYYWLDGQVGEMQFFCAGEEFTGGISEDGNVYLNGVKIHEIIENKVLMNGIVHFILPNCEEKQEIAKGIFAQNEQYPCVGVIFYEGNAITPMVWVRDVNTVFMESACASGSMAYAAWRGDGSYKILQPSQNFLYVRVENNICTVSGKVEPVTPGKNASDGSAVFFR